MSKARSSRCALTRHTCHICCHMPMRRTGLLVQTVKNYRLLKTGMFEGHISFWPQGTLVFGNVSLVSKFESRLPVRRPVSCVHPSNMDHGNIEWHGTYLLPVRYHCHHDHVGKGTENQKVNLLSSSYDCTRTATEWMGVVFLVVVCLSTYYHGVLFASGTVVNQGRNFL